MLEQIKAVLRFKGYQLYTRPYELNIVGLRSSATEANKFDDQLHVFYKTTGISWEYHSFRITTDPGTYWLRNPMQAQGTAILREGQYIHAYAQGMHRGQYKALVQVKPISIIRDYDRNALLDFNNGNITKGMYGINIHRANSQGKTKSIDKYSAGCQVFENAADFAAFLKLTDKHRSLYGNAFTYTLIDFRAILRQKLRWTAYGAAVAGVIGIGIAAYYSTTKNKLHETLHQTVAER